MLDWNSAFIATIGDPGKNVWSMNSSFLICGIGLIQVFRCDATRYNELMYRKNTSFILYSVLSTYEYWEGHYYFMVYAEVAFLPWLMDMSCLMCILLMETLNKDSISNLLKKHLYLLLPPVAIILTGKSILLISKPITSSIFIAIAGSDV